MVKVFVNRKQVTNDELWNIKIHSEVLNRILIEKAKENKHKEGR